MEKLGVPWDPRCWKLGCHKEVKVGGGGVKSQGTVKKLF